MLIEIIQNRLIEASRQEIAQNAKASITAFRQGEFQPQAIETVISELQKTLAKNV